MLLSSAGLVSLMYGVVEAGDNGWSSSSAVVPVVVGFAVLAAFVALGVAAGAIRSSTSRSSAPRSFTWGIVCTALGAFGLFGVLFALPQYLQAIAGLDPQGSGLRLLPAVAGLIVGAVPADRVAARIGAKVTVAAGFAVVVIGTLIGSTLTATSSDGFIAGWSFLVGAGAGLGFATSASAALVELSADRAGVGSALLQAVVKLGPAFGASILGSVLNSTYQGQVNVAGLPAARPKRSRRASSAVSRWLSRWARQC